MQWIVPEEQIRTHIFWETTALVVVVPFMAYLMTNRSLPPPVRVLAGLTGLVTLLVDGSLLSKNRKLLKNDH